MEENNGKRRSYTDVVASLETHIIYINNHLGNIDSHLDKLNNNVNENTTNCAKNKTNIKSLWWIAGGTGAGILAIILKVLEVIG